MEQGTLAEFDEGGDDADRPAEEAAAVASPDIDDADLVDISEERFPEADEHIEFSVKQVDYTVEGSGDDEHPVLHVFGRGPAPCRSSVRRRATPGARRCRSPRRCSRPV